MATRAEVRGKPNRTRVTAKKAKPLLSVDRLLAITGKDILNNGANSQLALGHDKFAGSLQAALSALMGGEIGSGLGYGSDAFGAATRGVDYSLDYDRASQKNAFLEAIRRIAAQGAMDTVKARSQGYIPNIQDPSNVGQLAQAVSAIVGAYRNRSSSRPFSGDSGVVSQPSGTLYWQRQ